MRIPQEVWREVDAKVVPHLGRGNEGDLSVRVCDWNHGDAVRCQPRLCKHYPFELVSVVNAQPNGVEVALDNLGDASCLLCGLSSTSMVHLDDSVVDVDLHTRQVHGVSNVDGGKDWQEQ
jgi:hypothetical protein